MNRFLARLFAALLWLYPPGFRARFGEEMQAVYALALAHASQRGHRAAAAVAARELASAPGVLLRAYRDALVSSLPRLAEWVREGLSPARLPPPERDGRHSLRQAALEISLFAGLGAVWVACTYVFPARLDASLAKSLGLLGLLTCVSGGPLFLVGLGRGLPRWAYPAGGLLAAYSFLAAQQARLLPFWLLLAAGFGLLLAGMLRLNARQKTPMPWQVQRWGQSLRCDWTRLSFAVYGALPLAVLAAFDDSHLNQRTAWFAVAVGFMLAGAAVYIFSRRKSIQAAALLSGMTLAVWPAVLDRAWAWGRLGMRAPTGDLAFMLGFWAVLAALLLAPRFALPVIEKLAAGGRKTAGGSSTPG